MLKTERACQLSGKVRLRVFLFSAALRLTPIDWGEGKMTPSGGQLGGDRENRGYVET